MKEPRPITYARRHRVLRSSPIISVGTARTLPIARSLLSSPPEETSRADMVRRMLKHAHGLDLQQNCEVKNGVVTEPMTVNQAKNRLNIDAEQRKLHRPSSFSLRDPATAEVVVPNIDGAERDMDIDVPRNDLSFQTPHPTLLAATQAFKLGTSKPQPLTPGREFSPVPKVVVPKPGLVDGGKQKKGRKKKLPVMNSKRDQDKDKETLTLHGSLSLSRRTSSRNLKENMSRSRLQARATEPKSKSGDMLPHEFDVLTMEKTMSATDEILQIRKAKKTKMLDSPFTSKPSSPSTRPLSTQESRAHFYQPKRALSEVRCDINIPQRRRDQGKVAYESPNRSHPQSTHASPIRQKLPAQRRPSAPSAARPRTWRECLPIQSARTSGPNNNEVNNSNNNGKNNNDNRNDNDNLRQRQLLKDIPLSHLNSLQSPTSDGLGGDRSFTLTLPLFESTLPPFDSPHPLFEPPCPVFESSLGRVDFDRPPSQMCTYPESGTHYTVPWTDDLPGFDDAGWNLFGVDVCAASTPFGSGYLAAKDPNAGGGYLSPVERTGTDRDTSVSVVRDEPGMETRRRNSKDWFGSVKAFAPRCVSEPVSPERWGDSGVRRSRSAASRHDRDSTPWITDSLISPPTAYRLDAAFEGIEEKSRTDKILYMGDVKSVVADIDIVGLEVMVDSLDLTIESSSGSTQEKPSSHQIPNRTEIPNVVIPGEVPLDIHTSKAPSRRTRSGTIVAAVSSNAKRARSGTIIAPTRARSGTITSRARSGTIRANGGSQIVSNTDAKRTREDAQQGLQEQNHDPDWVDEDVFLFLYHGPSLHSSRAYYSEDRLDILSLGLDWTVAEPPSPEIRKARKRVDGGRHAKRNIVKARLKNNTIGINVREASQQRPLQEWQVDDGVEDELLLKPGFNIWE